MPDGSKNKYECIHISIHKKVNSKNVIIQNLLILFKKLYGHTKVQLFWK